MRYEGFIGGTAQLTSVNVDAERTMNLYPEIIDAGTPANNVWLRRRNGYQVFSPDIGGGPVRGLFYQDGRAFAVSGTRFCELFADGSCKQWGIVNSDDRPAFMASNGQIGNQLLIVSGGGGYIFTLNANVLTPIVAVGFPPNATNAIFADSYFLAAFNNRPAFAFSALADGTSWAGLDVAQKSQTSDNLLAMVYDHKELWLVGSKTIEIWFDTGDANNPWTPQPILIETGIGARDSIAKGDDSIFWLRSGEYGAASVMRAKGYTPTRISPHSVEEAFAAYSRIDDAFAYFYEDEGGHGFYVLTFPTADHTWVYDVRTEQWHERGYWSAAEGDYHADLGRCHAWAAAWNVHLIGSRLDGTIYQSVAGLADDAGNPIRWMRRAPHVTAENKRLFFNRFEVAMRTSASNTPGPGLDPYITMRMSRDGGNTWTNEKAASLGPFAQYQRRIFWTRLGTFRSGLFEVAGDDPLFLGIYDAFLDVLPGVN